MRPVEREDVRGTRHIGSGSNLTEAETEKLLAALKRNRQGHRDGLVGLIIYRHGLRVSKACDLRWDDIDLPKRTIIVRRLKGSTDSVNYLERDDCRQANWAPTRLGYGKAEATNPRLFQHRVGRKAAQSWPCVDIL